MLTPVLARTYVHPPNCVDPSEMVAMTRLLCLWLGVTLAVAVVLASAGSAVAAVGPHSRAVSVAARRAAGFHGATLANAAIGEHCDWPGMNDRADARSASPPDCVAKCNADAECTHFVYQPRPGGDGQCFLKAGPVTADEATLRSRRGIVYTCGLLPERLAPMLSREADDDDDDDFGPAAAPTPSPVTQPAGFHGDTLGNAVVGHNCDWPRMNDFMDKPSSTPFECLTLCNGQAKCTHFVYMRTVGSVGWCHLKEGPVTAEEATLWSPSDTVYTCGLLPGRLASTPSPTATPTQIPPPPANDPSNGATPTEIPPYKNAFDDASATETPADDSQSHNGNSGSATCNIRAQDCVDTKAAITSRYLNHRCLPPSGSGLLTVSAAALADAFAAIERYGCCARNADRAKLLSVARLLVASDTCAAVDVAPLPVEAGTADLTHGATVEGPPDVPPVDTSITALGALGVLSGGMAAGEPGAAQTIRRDVRPTTRNSYVHDHTNPVWTVTAGSMCCEDNIKYDRRGCCPGWCWFVSDILHFFDLNTCCAGVLTPLQTSCPS